MYTVLNEYSLSRYRTPDVIGLASLIHFLQKDMPQDEILVELNGSILNGQDPMLVQEAFELVFEFISI
jgi:hypothetical protein